MRIETNRNKIITHYHINLLSFIPKMHKNYFFLQMLI